MLSDFVFVPGALSTGSRLSVSTFYRLRPKLFRPRSKSKCSQVTTSGHDVPDLTLSQGQALLTQKIMIVITLRGDGPWGQGKELECFCCFCMADMATKFYFFRGGGGG